MGKIIIQLVCPRQRPKARLCKYLTKINLPADFNPRTKEATITITDIIENLYQVDAAPYACNLAKTIFDQNELTAEQNEEEKIFAILPPAFYRIIKR